METEEIIKLTCALYNVIEIFPRNEPLGNAIKKRALNVLAGYCLLKAEDFSKRERREASLQKVLESIAVLENYFKLAQERKWVKEENFKVLSQYYNEIKKDVQGNIGNRVIIGKPQIVKEKRQGPASTKKPERVELIANLKKNRHKKIIQELQKRGEAQVRDFEQILPNVTKRTIRRDMGYLMGLGLIGRNGDKSATSYKIKE